MQPKANRKSSRRNGSQSSNLDTPGQSEEKTVTNKVVVVASTSEDVSQPSKMDENLNSDQFSNTPEAAHETFGPEQEINFNERQSGCTIKLMIWLPSY